MSKKVVSLHILFICTGNICRSPIAERLAHAHGSTDMILKFSASSAGTRAVIGHSMHKASALALRDLGGDSTAFVARQLTAKIATGADLIVTMTRLHRDAVLELAPRMLPSTYVLAEAARLASDPEVVGLSDLIGRRHELGGEVFPDIADPMGQDAEVHRRVASQIQGLLAPILDLAGKE